MTADRAEWTGVGAAFVFHVLLIAALSTSLASMEQTPEPPPMEVELVDEVALQSAAPTPVAQPARAEPPPLAQQPPQPQAQPEPIAPPPPPQPRAMVQPTARPAPQPPRPRVQPQPRPRTENQPRQRPGLGDDFLKSFDDELAPSNARARPAAPRFDDRAKANVAALFQRLVQPCANNQINPGEGANRIRVTLNLRLRPNGTLSGVPQIVRVTGVDDENERFEQRVKDLAVAVYRECSPFSGLPSDLYRTPEGGWSNINLTYKLP